MAMQKYFVTVAIAVLLSLHVFSNIVKYAQAGDVVQLPAYELHALRDLFLAWNKNTEDVKTSLQGWRYFENPNTTTVDPCFLDSWRGVFCYIVLNKTASKQREDVINVWDARVVGLTVSDASIVGTLPDSVWNFKNLVSLTLTGNPRLTGHIPPGPTNDIADRWQLKSLDLHGNGLNGSIPNLLFLYCQWIEDLDLSNNRLNGTIPKRLGLNEELRTLNLSNNNLTGNLPWNISENWTNLVTADLSSNRFAGNLPNLTSSIALHSLIFSHNEFGGQISLSVLNPWTNYSLAILDLSDNKFTGPMPNLDRWFDLQSLNLSNNKFDAGFFPSWLSNLTSLQTLGLSRTSLTGELNLSIFNSLKSLRTLELDDNNITGTLNIDSLPYNTSLHTIRLQNNQIGKVVFSSNVSALRITFEELDENNITGTLNIDSLPYNTSLRTIRLQNNQIGNVIFSSSNVSALLITFELQRNPYCDTETTDIKRCLCERRCYNSKADSKRNKKIIIASAVGASLGAVMMIIAAILYWKNRRDRQYLLLAVHEKFAEYEMKPTLFAYSELEKATRNFHSDMKLGEGGFGAVYKGNLADGSVVAVKQLLTKAQQNMDDFLNEVVLLTSVKHRNLVKLKGCCLRGDRRLLVYEYVDNYDLAETLFEHKGDQLVSWPARFNICLGVAHGLHYLHAGVDPRIIHRDVKANNVLLDSNLHPKIADFGLAMLFPNEDTHITIVQIAGTKGYLAPEYATRGQLSDKVDVFSFGVLALEVVSGRKNIAFDVPSDKTYLIEWAWNLNEDGRLRELVDPTLSIQADEEVAVQRVMTTALACLQTAAERRPTMAQVVGMLKGDIEIGESVRGRLNENVHQSHRRLLGLTSSATSLVPVDVECQALYLGESSGPGSGARSLELSALGGRGEMATSG